MTYLGDRVQPVVEFTGEVWVHDREKMVAVAHFDGKHEVLLSVAHSGSAIGRRCIAEVSCRGRYVYVPAVTVESVHDASEHYAVWRGVTDTCVSDGIVDHLMEQHALELMLALIVVVAHAQRVVVVDDFSPRAFPLERERAQPSARPSDVIARFGQPPVEISAVERLKVGTEPWKSDLHENDPLL